MKGQYQVYKKSGALQVSLIGYNEAEHKSGAVYLEAANCKDPNNRSYEWENGKIKFALGASDIAQIFEVLDSNSGAEIRLFHVPNGNAEGAKNVPGKRLTMIPATDEKYAGSWRFQFDDQIAGTKCFVPLGRGEFRIFIELCKAALPIMLGWT